ncbi:hypothetical protein KP509_29G008200 [Ceratopteris richardii]|uniref:Peptidase S59 domain-containing protein n=1 Tax=Ceratopteris richardii TaxID=49495 RepID=A0A8T2R5M0_CERRI|nr:hypothetical protein KP509_29G008200 [Ceratopteris richardii]KAH7291248.1 hypothetical protein KP509_29G008200 [Ceratopteris richardii]
MEDPQPHYFNSLSEGTGCSMSVPRLCSKNVHHHLPKLKFSNYFTVPSVEELAAREYAEPGYCSKVRDFVIGCEGYGSIKFLGETDIRWLELDTIVCFRHQEVIVYPDESTKPCIGFGLNKPAEVCLLHIHPRNKATKGLACEGSELEIFVELLKQKTKSQGAKFISYDVSKQEWRFQVEHFSRFGLDDSDEDIEPKIDARDPLHMDVELGQDLVPASLDKNTERTMLWQSDRSYDDSEEMEAEGSPMHGLQHSALQTALPHSLPQQLRLDPMKMQQMKMLFFSSEDEADIPTLPKVSERVPFRLAHKARSPGAVDNTAPLNRAQRKDQLFPAEESPKQVLFSKHIMKLSPQSAWKHTPSHSPNSLGRHLGLQIEEGSPLKQSRLLLSHEGKKELSKFKKPKVGFESTLDATSCMYGKSGDVVDAALFLGRSFRVGWGPHGLLVHSGNPVGVEGLTLSSMVQIEKVALDACVRDSEGRIRDELIELQFISPLNLHMSFSKVVDGMDDQAAKIRLRFVQCRRDGLRGICDKYEDILVKQHAVEGLASSLRLVLRHQVMAWHLLSVLFSEKSAKREQMVQDAEELEMIDDMKVSSPVLDSDVAALVRRAEFSRWLQDSVRLAVQDEMRDLESKDHLKVLFAHLTGRQLDDGVQLAVSRGDVRLACLVSQAGSSMSMRRDISCQLEVWEKQGLDFSLIERDMVLLYKLLSGDIDGALEGRTIDWKRFLGLLMWYHLAPDTQIPDIIKSYSLLIEQGAAPPPIPMYVEEGTAHDLTSGQISTNSYDTIYHLMLLHASQGQNIVDTSKMFSSFSSTYDPLDHRMAWLQRGLLESIEAFAPAQMHILDMNFVAQLLSIGECHWAIYVALHMPPSVDYPGLHEKVVKEILNQYCEVFSTNELQQIFIAKELGVPEEWLHEALGMYWQYFGDVHKAIKHLLQSMQWQKAHLLLVTSVGATLFLAGDQEELLEIVTLLERHKMELDDWALSGGIYSDFYVLRNSFRSNDFTKKLGSFESKTAACKSFYNRLKESQHLWENRHWEAKNRVVYARMAHELTTLLLKESKAQTTLTDSSNLNLHNVLMDAPVPQDDQFYRLQGAASSFTSWLLQTVPR